MVGEIECLCRHQNAGFYLAAIYSSQSEARCQQCRCGKNVGEGLKNVGESLEPIKSQH